MIISVIVPVYNMEKYLEKCLLSIINQSYFNLEIILVNDGSTDDSGGICKKYAEIDGRIKYICQAHKGLVYARKTGINNAVGDYITFVDADDWVDINYIEKMYCEIHNFGGDIISSGMIWEFSDHVLKMFDSIEEGIYERTAIVRKIIPQMLHNLTESRQGIIASVCTKFFNRSLLMKSLQNVDESLTIGEDAAIVYPAIMDSNKVIITNICAYHYRQHESSMLHSSSGFEFDQIKKMIDFIQKEFEKRGFEDFFLRQRDDFSYLYVKSSIEEMFSLELYNYIPPVYSIPPKSRIALYGAGKVGKSFYRIFCNKEKYNLVGWYDANYAELSKYIPVLNPEEIKNEDIDYIIITIANKEVAEQVRHKLEKTVSRNKILHWEYEMLKF